MEYKGKVHPRTALEGPEGELRYICTLYLILALEGVCVERQATAALNLESSSAHCTGGWLGPRADLDGLE